MSRNHSVRINVRTDENRETIMEGGIRRIPKRLITLLFGENADVLVLTTGKTVSGIEIRETREEAKQA